MCHMENVLLFHSEMLDKRINFAKDVIEVSVVFIFNMIFDNGYFKKQYNLNTVIHSSVRDSRLVSCRVDSTMSY